MFLLWIAIVVLLFIIMKQNGRISLLEQKITGKVETKVNMPAQTPQTAAAPSVISAATPSSVPPSTTPAPEKPLEFSKHDEESSGKILGRVGIAAVLMGVAFFLKYAFENNWVGPTGRVMIGVVIGVAFLVVGQLLRHKYLKYSDLLMGGGSGILYLSFFSAYSFYHLISAPVTGLLMLCVTALTFAISIVNATPTLSFIGVIGAFATPFLVGSYAFSANLGLSLFVYLSIINVGVLGISFFKKWPKLNILTFAGTAINFIVWFAGSYSQNYLGQTLTFCFVTFIIFLLANIARSIVAGQKTDQADYFLIGANAFAMAIMGYIILEPQHHAVLGFASVLIAIVYMIFAFFVNKSNPQDKTLNIFLPGLAVTFLSIAVPLQFSGPWIAVAWLVESVALYFIASVISNRGFQVMGVVVYCLGLADLITWIGDNMGRVAFVPIMNTSFVVTILAVVVAYIIAFFYKKYGSTTVEIQKRGIMVFIVIANVLTVFALTTQITQYYSQQRNVAYDNYTKQQSQNEMFNAGYNDYSLRSGAYATYNAYAESLRNRSNTWVSILWALYAAALTAIGFAKRIASIRRLGLILFLITAVKVLFNVWSLGQLYRIISFITFGIIALVASFAYAKYKDRLKDVV